MGTSAFDPVVLADVRSVKNKIDVSGLTGDVLSVGDVIRYEPDSDTYVRAIADSNTNANFMGVIESITSTEIVVVYSGEISLPNTLFSSFSGYTAAEVFYLSDTTEGELTPIAPTNPGSVIKPVLLVTGTLDGADGEVDAVVINTLGQSIVGDSTVDLSEVQPVGTISAFAGNTSDIPSGWDICDGGFLSISTYADLYDALNDGKIYGFIQNISMSVVTNSGTGRIKQDELIGSKFYIFPTGQASAFECTFLSGTVGVNVITNADVFVNPIYANGVDVGTYHNAQIQVNDQSRITRSTGTVVNCIYRVTAQSKTQFKKPDLRSRLLIGDSRGITGLENSAFDSYILGKNYGEEYHTLTTAEIPTHNHTLSGLTAAISGSITATHNLTTSSAGTHRHRFTKSKLTTIPGDDDIGGTLDSDISESLYVGPIADLTDGGDYAAGTPNGFQETPQNVAAGPNEYPISYFEMLDAGAHTHNINGNISISTNNLTPLISGSIANVGGNLEHNNVPQSSAVIWIIKTRKDGIAKILRLGPSGGGAVIAKNTPKRWVRATSGAGCTVDASYGNFTVSRLSQGNYQFTHDMVNELGITAQDKYIVEVSVTSGSSADNAIFLANAFNLQGMTLGISVYDVLGTTHSDDFQYLNVVLYGGGTAL